MDNDAYSNYYNQPPNQAMTVEPQQPYHAQIPPQPQSAFSSHAIIATPAAIQSDGNQAIVINAYGDNGNNNNNNGNQYNDPSNYASYQNQQQQYPPQQMYDNNELIDNNNTSSYITDIDPLDGSSMDQFVDEMNGNISSSYGPSRDGNHNGSSSSFRYSPMYANNSI